MSVTELASEVEKAMAWDRLMADRSTGQHADSHALQSAWEWLGSKVQERLRAERLAEDHPSYDDLFRLAEAVAMGNSEPDDLAATAEKLLAEHVEAAAAEALDPVELRERAVSVIGEDRVPTDVLAELVRDFGS